MNDEKIFGYIIDTLDSVRRCFGILLQYHSVKLVFLLS